MRGGNLCLWLCRIRGCVRSRRGRCKLYAGWCERSPAQRGFTTVGAGWDPEDLARWRDFGCFDSVDSVAYYTDARDGWQWTHGGRVFSDAPWREIAAANAAVAVQIAGEG